jgi:amidohydrolase
VPEDVTSTLDDVTAYLAEHGSELVAVRRELHAHPELSGQEVRTTAMLEERLRAAGLRPERLARGTGLVCDIGGSTGPTVALRADIDALAMVDRKDVSYRSQVDGAAHACGHDVHTTVVLGAGLALQASGALAAGGGRVRLVFEPSEESLPGGAVDVLAEGWFDDVDAVFGIHCDPKVDVGHLGVRVGALTSSTDMIAVTVRGPGGHTARPELTVNLLAVVGRLLSELPGRVASLATGPVRVVFGSVHAGDAANVIPVEAVVRGTFRTPAREVWAQAGQLARRASSSLGRTPRAVRTERRAAVAASRLRWWRAPGRRCRCSARRRRTCRRAGPAGDATRWGRARRGGRTTPAPAR